MVAKQGCPFRLSQETHMNLHSLIRTTKATRFLGFAVSQVRFNGLIFNTGSGAFSMVAGCSPDGPPGI
jgi:hypothetical protein